MIGIEDMSRLISEMWYGPKDEKPTGSRITEWAKKNDLDEEALTEMASQMIESGRRLVIQDVIVNGMESSDAFDTCVGSISVTAFILGFEAHKEYGQTT